MKKFYTFLLFVILLFSFSCKSQTNESKENRIYGTVVSDHVIELPVITDIDYDRALVIQNTTFGLYEGGCSTIAKKINGEMIVGRSMDLTMSYNPAYIIRTAVPGHYKTLGLSYYPHDLPTFEEAQKNGISQSDLDLLLFFTTDIMNEKGLYIEGNMRPQESKAIMPESNGTNPGAKYRMSIAGLIRFLGENAGSVEEAVKLANEVDVHSLKTEYFDWNGSLLLADSSGNYGVLELAGNKLYWLPGQRSQTNFYLNKDYSKKAEFGNGYGRYETLENGIDSVRTQQDMIDLVDKVKYSRQFKKETRTFDPITDFTGSYAGERGMRRFNYRLTVKDALDPKNKDFIWNTILNPYFEKVNSKSIEQIRKDATDWASIFQVLANCNEKTLRVKFFEDPNNIKVLSVD